MIDTTEIEKYADGEVRKFIDKMTKTIKEVLADLMNKSKKVEPDSKEDYFLNGKIESYSNILCYLKIMKDCYSKLEEPRENNS